MGSRRRSREIALQTLYALELGRRSLDEALQDMRERVGEPSGDGDDLADMVRGGGEVQDFAEKLVRGVMTHREAIDALVGHCSTNWKIARMAAVDRNLLRLATYELLHLEDIPTKVTLNEAIEIAKRYGTADSSAFINGILDRIASQEEARG
jgi:N utilization substance protein B